MVKSRPILILSTVLFGAVEVLLGIFLQVSSGWRVIAFSYAAVALACLFCLLFVERSADYYLTQTALLFTVFADYFLVVASPIRQLPAMLFFSVTQLAYFGRIYLADDNGRRKRLHLILRAASVTAVTAVTVLVLGRKADAVALVSMFYYANLVLNLVFAFADFRKHVLLALGLLLFLGCDTFIGLAFLDIYFDIPADSLLYDVLYPGFDPAWAFYVPSQTLLAASLLPKRLKAA